MAAFLRRSGSSSVARLAPTPRSTDAADAQGQAGRARFLSDRAKALEPAAWMISVRDLKQVLTVTQAIFLLLIHNNEAVLRVAVELATDQMTRVCLNWNDGEKWFVDDHRREWFRSRIKDKVKLVLRANGVSTRLGNKKKSVAIQPVASPAGSGVGDSPRAGGVPLARYRRKMSHHMNRMKSLALSDVSFSDSDSSGGGDSELLNDSMELSEQHVEMEAAAAKERIVELEEELEQVTGRLIETESRLQGAEGSLAEALKEKKALQARLEKLDAGSRASARRGQDEAQSDGVALPAHALRAKMSLSSDMSPSMSSWDISDASPGAPAATKAASPTKAPAMHMSVQTEPLPNSSIAVQTAAPVPAPEQQAVPAGTAMMKHGRRLSAEGQPAEVHRILFSDPGLVLPKGQQSGTSSSSTAPFAAPSAALGLSPRVLPLGSSRRHSREAPAPHQLAARVPLRRCSAAPDFRPAASPRHEPPLRRGAAPGNSGGHPLPSGAGASQGVSAKAAPDRIAEQQDPEQVAAADLAAPSAGGTSPAAGSCWASCRRASEALDPSDDGSKRRCSPSWAAAGEEQTISLREADARLHAALEEARAASKAESDLLRQENRQLQASLHSACDGFRGFVDRLADKGLETKFKTLIAGTGLLDVWERLYQDACRRDQALATRQRSFPSPLIAMDSVKPDDSFSATVNLDALRVDSSHGYSLHSPQHSQPVIVRGLSSGLGSRHHSRHHTRENFWPPGSPTAGAGEASGAASPSCDFRTASPPILTISSSSGNVCCSGDVAPRAAPLTTLREAQTASSFMEGGTFGTAGVAPACSSSSTSGGSRHRDFREASPRAGGVAAGVRAAAGGLGAGDVPLAGGQLAGAGGGSPSGVAGGGGSQGGAGSAGAGGRGGGGGGQHHINSSTSGHLPPRELHAASPHPSTSASHPHHLLMAGHHLAPSPSGTGLDFCSNKAELSVVLPELHSDTPHMWRAKDTSSLWAHSQPVNKTASRTFAGGFQQNNMHGVPRGGKLQRGLKRPLHAHGRAPFNTAQSLPALHGSNHSLAIRGEKRDHLPSLSLSS